MMNDVTNFVMDSDAPAVPEFVTENSFIKEKSTTLPQEFKVYQNYPNPFNPVTNITFELPYTTYAKIKLLNLLGETIKIIAEDVYRVGRHKVTLDGSDLPAGMYFYSIETSDFIGVKRLLVLK